MEGVAIAGLVCGLVGAVLLGWGSYIRTIPGSGGDVDLQLSAEARRRVLRTAIPGWVLIGLAFLLQLIGLT